MSSAPGERARNAATWTGDADDQYDLARVIQRALDAERKDALWLPHKFIRMLAFELFREVPDSDPPSDEWLAAQCERVEREVTTIRKVEAEYRARGRA